MGISSSSYCFMINNFSNAKAAKLFDAEGNFVRQVKLPLKAAELMLEEEPGHIISPADEIRRTGRFMAMKAEDELVARKVYLLVPLCRVNRKVSDSDMALVDLACKKRSRTSSKRTSSKILPAATVEEKEEFRVEEKVISGYHLGLHLKGYIRGWNPVLEPISET
ncbi:hypothetical protein FNV43_RR23624 [Rhamnella rubrinervis]|uniref:Uncharacterized protein n=1 Tax=Rhamnella rubrinervis TaxID=2594499 RepID=A0A8K0DSD1_9ROSA|nr:hypothetical protein FNV43_RR23624 [Rhamnella rubrinervis]